MENDAIGAASLTDKTLVALHVPAGVATWVGSAVGLYVLGQALVAHLMPRLPVADANSPKWYRTTFGILAWITGNYGKNAPVPPSGQPAGGIVPNLPAPKA